ncbi:MAG TPA: tetratricopeptide repeat protein [Blastocatellia bacterium]|nr:tetratricopeptide repeat protein [Blastocatellia bacterium]
MLNSQFLKIRRRSTGLRVLLALAICPALIATAVGQGNIIVFGRVSLPDGKPAIRVPVKLEMANGLKRETLTDDYGRYEIAGLSAGRYQVSATNPDAPEQYSERAESDSTRAFSNRVQIDVYLRLPLHSGKREAKPGTVSVAEVTQDIPKAARKAFDQGVKLQKENQREKALTAFNQAIELYPEYFQALTERANVLMGGNQLAEAAADFERALRLNEKYVPALRGLGYCQIQQKQFEPAVNNLELAFSIDPKIPLTLLLLGYANLSLNRYEPAKQCFEEALKLGPESAARAHVYLAEVFAHEQKFKEAADSIHRYLSLKPGAADAADLRKMESDWRGRGKAVKDKN